MGYDIVIYPVSSLRLANKAVEIGYKTLRNKGTLEGLLPQMLSREELYEVIHYGIHEDMARDLHKEE